MLGKLKPTEHIGRWPFYLVLLFALLPIGAGAQGASEGSGLRQFLLVLLFGASATVFIRQPRRIGAALNAVPITFLLLLLYVAFSVYWSPERYVSFKRVIQIFGVTLMAMALIAGGNGTYRLHRIVSPVLIFGMILAVAVTAAFPDFAFAKNGLRAFMATKNVFGQFAAITVLFGFAYLLIERKHHSVFVPLVIVALVGLGFSQSLTSMLGLLAVAGFLALVAFNRKATPFLKTVFALGIVSVLLVGHGFGVVSGYPSIRDLQDLLYELTGRDVTLTGRTYLWELMFNEIAKHPWLGTGYGGFWLGLQGASGYVAYLVQWGYPGQAHNGYIDTLNELGIVGFSLLIAFVVHHSFNLLALAKKDLKYSLFHASIFIFLLTLNLAEAAILRTTHFWWMVFVASAIEVNWRLKAESVPVTRVSASANNLKPLVGAR